MSKALQRLSVYDGAFMLATVGVIGDYVYHDVDWVTKQLITRQINKIEKDSSFPLLAPFNNNFLKLEKNKSTEPKTTIIAGPRGVGKSTTLAQFSDNEKNANKRKSIIISLKSSIGFQSDTFANISENVFESLGIPKRSSYMRTAGQIIGNIFTDLRIIVLLEKMNQERVNKTVTLLYDLSKELHDKSNNTPINLIFDDFDYLISIPSIKKTGGLSLFSTIAYLSTTHMHTTNTFLSGDSSLTFLEAIRRSNLHQTKYDTVAFTDCEVDEYVSCGGEGKVVSGEKEEGRVVVSAVDSRGPAPVGRSGTRPTTRGGDEAPTESAAVMAAAAVAPVSTLAVKEEEKGLLQKTKEFWIHETPVALQDSPELRDTDSRFQTSESTQTRDMSARELLESRGYSPSEASSILLAFGTRLGELSHFLGVQGMGQTGIDARLASRSKDITTFFHHLVEKQNTKVEDKQYALMIADRLARYETQSLSVAERVSTELVCQSSVIQEKLRKNMYFNTLFCVDLSQGVDVAEAHVRFQSPLIAYIYLKERENIVSRCVLKEVVGGKVKGKKGVKQGGVDQGRTWMGYFGSWF